MLLYLVRHGETDWNLARRIQGRTDIPLNDTGRGQAAATGALLARRSWDAVVTSPLSRALETGQIIAAELGMPEPTTDVALVERNYGEAEGMDYLTLSETFPEGAEVPGRESHDEVAARALPALLQIARAHPGQAVVVVAHGGVIRSVLGAVDPTGKHGMITNGSIHSLRYEDGDLSLIAFNDPIEVESLDVATDDLDVQNELEHREDTSTRPVTHAR